MVRLQMLSLSEENEESWNFLDRQGVEKSRESLIAQELLLQEYRTEKLESRCCSRDLR